MAASATSESGQQVKRQRDKDTTADSGASKDIPSADDEQDMYQLSVQFSIAEAKARLFELEPARAALVAELGISHKEAAKRVATGPLGAKAKDYRALFCDSLAVWEKAGWAYDPGRRRFVRHLSGVDPALQEPFFLHRPVAHDDLGAARARATATKHSVANEYTAQALDAHRSPQPAFRLRILHTETLRHQSTVHLLQENLCRRFVAARASRVVIIRAHPAAERRRDISFFDAETELILATTAEDASDDFALSKRPVPSEATASAAASSASASHSAEQHIVDAPRRAAASLWVRDSSVGEGTGSLGERVNAEFEAAIAEGADLVVLDCGNSFRMGAAPKVRVPTIVPVYPAVLEPGLLVLTPAQLEQLNGTEPGSSRPADVIDSVLARAGFGMGAVLVDKAAQDPGLPGHDDGAWHLRGLNRLRDGFEADGRVTRVRECVGRHSPTAGHGWLSLDTHAALLAALRTVKPSCVLEMGTWYGRSTRLIRRSAPGAVILAVDWFKNNAKQEWAMSKLGPADKLFLCHPRFEAFAANMTSCEAAMRPVADESAASSPAAVAAEEPLSGAPVALGPTFMLKADAHEAVGLVESLLMHASRSGRSLEAPQVVFIDCEKKTGPLLRLLDTIHRAFPEAVVVGDDLVYDSVKRAIRQRPVGTCIALSEAYISLPPRSPAGLLEALTAAVHEAKTELALPEPLQRASDAIQAGDGVALLREWPPAMALRTKLPYADGDTLLHELCRKRDVRALESVWEQLTESALGWSPPMINSAALTPWDYLTHRMAFHM